MTYCYPFLLPFVTFIASLFELNHDLWCRLRCSICAEVGGPWPLGRPGVTYLCFLGHPSVRRRLLVTLEVRLHVSFGAPPSAAYSSTAVQFIRYWPDVH